MNLTNIEKKELAVINKMIARTGLKKKFIADLVGLTPVELSYLLNGKRKYDDAKKLLHNYLILTLNKKQL